MMKDNNLVRHLYGVRDDGRREHDLLGQDGHADAEPDDGGAGLGVPPRGGGPDAAC